MNKHKFDIGDTVYNKVERKGSYEPSICRVMSKLTVDGVKKYKDSFKYICDYDGYEFMEDELMSREEAIKNL